jgi:cytochrome c-type biogenesis protein CcmE
MKKYWKFIALVALVIGVLVALGWTGAADTKTYYKTIGELKQMGPRAYGQRLRVAGDVATGSIQRAGKDVEFVLEQDNTTLKVVYTGSETLPDTFKDGAQALADGKLDKDGVFRAARIQAKCASKYESKPQLAPGQASPNINGGKSTI